LEFVGKGAESLGGIGWAVTNDVLPEGEAQEAQGGKNAGAGEGEGEELFAFLRRLIGDCSIARIWMDWMASSRFSKTLKSS